MTKMEQFLSLFPLKGEITQEILDKTTIDTRTDSKRCPGALTFTAALGENIKLLDGPVKWLVKYAYFGENRIDKECIPGITTLEGIRFTLVDKPQTVTFIIVK